MSGTKGTVLFVPHFIQSNQQTEHVVLWIIPPIHPGLEQHKTKPMRLSSSSPDPSLLGAAICNRFFPRHDPSLAACVDLSVFFTASEKVGAH